MPPVGSQPRKPDEAAAANERNQYIPSFIASKPFYVPDTESGKDDYLEHQRLQKVEDQSLKNAKWYDRGKKGLAATKYRKGACENCGAMTHKARDCLSRPRKAGAKWTGRDIEADEVVQDVKLGWDAKRDRWNGYDATEYQAVISEFNQLEALKRSENDDEDEQKDIEGAKYEEETDMGRQQSTSTRQLRLREDTAKYLLNLDLDSAQYDPKTRSMLDSGVSEDRAAALVAEEDFVRKSGDAAEFERAQRYAWEIQERGAGSKMHLQANPTAGEILRKKETGEAVSRKAAQRKALLDKYGGEEHLDSAPLKDAMVAESERFIEYDESGGIKGAPKTNSKSKYAEDVYINNHTSVWGSWWSDFRWGYSCCHSTMKNSYCTGEEGKKAFEDEQIRRAGLDLEEPDEVRAIEAPPEKLKPADDAEKRKRSLEEMHDGVTEEDIDQYHKKRANLNDPMAHILGKDELVH